MTARKSSGRTVRVVLTEEDLYTLGRALGALDVLVLGGREVTVTREALHELWGRLKDAEKRLEQ